MLWIVCLTAMYWGWQIITTPVESKAEKKQKQEALAKLHAAQDERLAEQLARRAARKCDAA